MLKRIASAVGPIAMGWSGHPSLNRSPSQNRLPLNPSQNRLQLSLNRSPSQSRLPLSPSPSPSRLQSS